MKGQYEILVACGSFSSASGGLEIMALQHFKDLKNNKFNVELLTANRVQNMDVLPILNKKRKIKSIISLTRLLSSNNIKIIHTHNSHDLWILVPALVMSRSKAKLYLTKHMASGVNKKDIFHKFLYNRVNKIFAISNFIRQNVIDTCPVPENKVYLLQNGVNLSEFNKSKYEREDIRKELGISNEKILIGLVGRITLGKGHYELIKAAEIINKKHRVNVIFLIVGSSSKQEEHIEKEIKKLAAQCGVENIIFLGYRTDIARILAGMDILVFPSHEESFGITLLEAMAMEVPVVATGNAGVTDIIPSNEFGLLVPPKDPESLARKILELINNPSLRKTLSENGKKRIIENFDSEKITMELLKQYEER